MTDIETMKLALEALDDRSSLMKWQKAREALRQAIEQAEQAQHPAGFVDDGGTVFWKDKPPADGADLYTTPPPRQPEPVIDKSAAIRIATALGWTPPRKPWVGLTSVDWNDFNSVKSNDPQYVVAWAEIKLKEKNT